MKIAVLVKQVPSADSRLTLNVENLRLERTLTDPVLNPSDLHAVEAALQISDASGIQTVSISMGPVGVEQSTKRALAMGIDESVHVIDENLHGADIWVTANVLAKAILHCSADLVFAGTKSSDGQSEVVPAYVARLLDWNYVVVSSESELDLVLNLKKQSVVVVSEDFNTPRLPNFKGIAAAKNKPVSTLNLADLDLADIAPKTKIISQTTILKEKNPEKKSGTPKELAVLLLEQISKWSNVEDTQIQKVEINPASEVKVFTADQKAEAASFAAENKLALITDVCAAENDQFTKEIFDGSVKVVIECKGPSVITIADVPSSKGISVCVGGGVTSIDDLRIVAKSMEAEVVGTSAAFDKGHIDVESLVGASGRTISPNIYVGFGVSGAHYHFAGVRKPNYIAAVNKDPEAEIFAFADLAIVGDADEVLAALLQELGK